MAGVGGGDNGPSDRFSKRRMSELVALQDEEKADAILKQEVSAACCVLRAVWCGVWGVCCGREMCGVVWGVKRGPTQSVRERGNILTHTHTQHAHTSTSTHAYSHSLTTLTLTHSHTRTGGCKEKEGRLLQI